MSRALTIAATCLFGSGLCSLVYQTVWLRAFRLIFGASTPSTAAVLAIFLGGLGVGGILLGRRVERSERPLVTYGNLELGIALSAAVTPFLLDGASGLYRALGGSEGLGVLSTPMRLAISSLVLGVPVVLMGGTLPAAARAVTASADVGRKSLSLLYGLNTLGAVTGTLLSTFVLLEIYGARRTLWIACLLNALIALAARSVGRKLDVVPVAPPSTVVSEARGLSTRWVLIASFITGFVFVVGELVWYRLAAPLLGGSTYTFGLVLACALLGVGVGGVLYALTGPKAPTAGSFALTCALEALVLILPFAAGDELAYLAFHLENWGRVSFPLLVVSWSVVAGILVVPPAIVAGYQFPMLLSLKGHAERDVGKDSGEVYAANTLGSIVGSLSGGFLLLPQMTALGLWRASAGALAALAIVVAVLAGRDLRSRVVVGVVVALTFACFTATGPTAIWRHSAIGAGRAQLQASMWNERRYIESELQRGIAAEYEGRESSVAVGTGYGVSPLVNGKSDGNSYQDAPTGVGSGMLPALLQGAPKRAFVLGLGTGQTAGWLGAIPSMEHVDVVEIEPTMTSFAELCAPTNHDALKNPKVELHIADGRELLLVTREKYDLVLSEPSNPYRAGLASLYSHDFYVAVADKLTDDGVFGQWVQGYEIDPAAVQLVIATLASVFPELSVWQLAPGDMLFIATKKPQVWDVERLKKDVETEPYRTVMHRLFGVTGPEGVLALHLGSNALLQQLARRSGDDLNTDDSPRLEFMFARSVGRRAGDDLRLDVYNLAHAHGVDRPAVKGDVDWALVDEQRARPFIVRNELPVAALAAALPAPLRLWANGRSKEALLAFDADERPRDAFVSLVHAAARADVAETDRTALDAELDAVRDAGYPADAAWLRVRAALVDNRIADLDALVPVAVDASRADPWPLDRVVVPTLQRLGDSNASAVVVDALNRGFAAYNFNNARAAAAWRLEQKLPLRDRCVETLAQFEPHPRWRADVLDLRSRCYERFRPADVETARADLDLYLAHAGGKFIE